MEINHKQYDSKQCYEVQIGSVHIGFSYNTPILLHDASPDGKRLKTNENFSRTTNRHLQLLASKADRVSQNELEREIEFALARQALHTLRERLNYGSTSTDTFDQSTSGLGIGSTVLREPSTPVEAG